MKINTYRKVLLYSVLCYAVSSISFLCIPFSDFNEDGIKRIMAYMVGGLFWSGLIVGLILTAVLGFWRKKASKKKCKLPGILCFFRNKQAMRCDSAMLLMIVLFIISQNFLGLYHWISIILLSSMLFSIYMHSVLNGNNYAYAMQRGVRK